MRTPRSSRTAGAVSGAVMGRPYPVGPSRRARRGDERQRLGYRRAVDRGEQRPRRGDAEAALARPRGGGSVGGELDVVEAHRGEIPRQGETDFGRRAITPEAATTATRG